MNDYRFNPFENVSTAVTITGETHVIPSVSPYTVRLREVPLKETPSSISLTIGGVAANEVSAPPSAGEFWPDYSTGADGEDGWNTGTILFNGADAGKTVVVSYVGTGTLVDTRTSHGQAIFKGSGVWICPEGIIKVFISMCGGGGGGGGASTSNSNGSSGGNGGITSFGSLLSASGGGGGGGASIVSAGAGGSAGGTGGTRGGTGFVGGNRALSGCGGSCILGAGGSPVSGVSGTGAGLPGAGFGAGGSGGARTNAENDICAAGGGGGAHSYLKQPVTVIPTTEYIITIGAGGDGGSSNYSGGNGAPGICIIEW